MRKRRHSSHVPLATLLLSTVLVVAIHDVSADCGGSMEKCGQIGEDGFLMESETSRRILQAARHISYGAIGHDSPACGNPQRGRPYRGTCLPPPSTNHNRGCSNIYRCRR
uniref:Uncharacterized protein n=1 Tax=Rhizophora mucronata TaxID=61149 RepID=A0A2P2IUE2_RHIMU